MPPGPTPEFVLARPRTAPLDPPPAYSRLCEEAPISRVTIWDGRRGAWLVTRWEDARAVLGHPAFSSDPSQPGYPDVQPDQPPQPPGFFANVDAPVHTTMRRTLTREFMVKKIDALRPTITGITGQLLDEIARSQGPVDLVERFALPLPSHPAERGLGSNRLARDRLERRRSRCAESVGTGSARGPRSGGGPSPSPPPDPRTPPRSLRVLSDMRPTRQTAAHRTASRRASPFVVLSAFPASQIPVASFEGVPLCPKQPARHPAFPPRQPLESARLHRASPS